MNTNGPLEAARWREGSTSGRLRPTVSSAMSKSPEVCPKCGHLLAEGSPDSSWCPGCGERCSSQRVASPPSMPGPPGQEEIQTPSERRRWRLCFWLCFLLTPAASLLLALLPNFFKGTVPGSLAHFLPQVAPFGVFGTVALGTLGAGFSLAKLHAKPRTTAGLIGVTITIAVGLAVVYVSILFVGCLILIK